MRLFVRHSSRTRRSTKLSHSPKVNRRAGAYAAFTSRILRRISSKSIVGVDHNLKMPTDVKHQADDQTPALAILLLEWRHYPLLGRLLGTDSRFLSIRSLDPDTWGYLSPALRKLTGAPFGHTSGRNFIYPGFVYLLLGVFRDFRAITIAQHLLGLVAGGMLLLTWHRLRVFVAHPRVSLRFYDAIGLVAAATFLLASEPVHFEDADLEPEGVCAFLFSINLYVLAQFTACRGHRAQERGDSSLWCCGCVYLRTAGFRETTDLVSVSFFSVLPMVVLLFQKNHLWQKVAIAAGALASVLLLWLPEHFLSRDDQISQTFLPTTLFVIHANLIRDQMADDLERNATLPYSQERLRRIHTALGTELSKSGKRYKTLGFDPDYLMYNGASLATQLRKEFGDDVSAVNRFYRFFYLRIWRRRPGAVLERHPAVGYFLHPEMRRLQIDDGCPAFQGVRRGVALLNSEWYRETWTSLFACSAFIDRTQPLTASSVVLRQPAYIGNLLDILARIISAVASGHFRIRRSFCVPPNIFAAC